MIWAGAAAMMLFALGVDDDQRRAPPPPGDAISFTQRQVIIRITPVAPRPRLAPAAGVPQLQWREGRGPRCVPWNRILAAISPRENSVDFVFRDGQRVRAQLERRCPTLDFYRSLYITPTRDGQLCADRDTIRSRTGGECDIDQFRSLTPARP
ncbi:MAG TPA: hypothetical protein VLK25_05415 [Allosphingosinicella sp.]|nr:hypothetical protein [Allosphingosinicella sp.]